MCLNSCQSYCFYLLVDLNNEQDTFLALEKADPDIIFHLAAESHVDRSIDNPESFVRSNIIGTFNLLQASLKHWKKLNKKISRKDRKN